MERRQASVIQALDLGHKEPRKEVLQLAQEFRGFYEVEDYQRSGAEGAGCWWFERWLWRQGRYGLVGR